MGFETSKKRIIKFLVVIIILLVIFAGFLLLINNPTFKMKSAVRYMFNEANTTLNTTKKSNMANAIMDNKVNVTNKIAANVSLSNNLMLFLGNAGTDIENFINNSVVETNITSDVPNKYMDFGVNYSYNSEKISANAYLDNNQMYLYLKDYFDKYIEVSQNDFKPEEFFNQMSSSIKIDDVQYVMNILKQSILENVDKSKITTAKEEIDIDNKKVPVNKTTFTIDNEFTQKVGISLLNKILVDDRAKEIIYSLVDHNEYPDMASFVDDMKNELSTMQSEQIDNTVIGEYSLYTSGIFSKIVRNELKISGDQEDVLQYTTYKTEKYDKQLAFYENNELIAEANERQTSKDNYDIALSFGKDVSMDIQGMMTKQLVDVTYTIRVSGMDDIKGNFKLETKDINENEMNQALTFKLDTPSSYGTLTLTVDSDIKIIDNINKPDFASNSVSSDSLTDYQINNMMTNFENKNPKVIQAINDIMSKFTNMFAY